MKWLLVLLLSLQAWGQPVLRELSPATGRAGSKVILNGSGFGSDPAAVKVFFGGVPAEITAVDETSVSVKVPDSAPRNSPVRLEVNGSSSGELAYLALPSIRITVGKNPLEAGETTTARFQVFQEDKPVEIAFSNANPGIVQFSGGDSQTIKTCGGPNNCYDFTITGIVGNRLYTINYQWGAQAVEFKEWKLGWNGVNWVEQGKELQPPPPRTHVKKPDSTVLQSAETARPNDRP
ncbi:MAG: IPT/TIG domain-containing protein [Vulcanimicrobiota bacterium]